MFNQGWNPDPHINGHPGVLHEGRGTGVCTVTPKDMKLQDHVRALGVLVDMKDPIVSLDKSWRVIAGTLNKLQIPSSQLKDWSTNS